MMQTVMGTTRRAAAAAATATARVARRGAGGQAALAESDPQVFRIIHREADRQWRSVQLIASENYTSRAVMDALGSCMTNKYSEGYPGARYYGGNQHIDAMERLCQERALAAFGLDPAEWFVNVQPLSGSPCNFYVYTALLTSVGADRIMSLDLPHGGHLSHGFELPHKKISAVSQYFSVLPYRLDAATGRIDYDRLAENALLFKPKLILAGASAHARNLDYARFRAIADSVGAFLMADMAHISGLVAAGATPSPFPHCHVVTTTTHKSLRGPRGAMIFGRRGPCAVPGGPASIEDAVNAAVFPGHQGGPHNHTISALAVALGEALRPEFKAYQRQVVANCARLAAGLQQRGFRLVSGGTDNHLLLVDLSPMGIDGARVEIALEAAQISTNKNTIPGDTKALVPSGLRLGTPAVTSRGFAEAEIDTVVGFLDRGIRIAVDLYTSQLKRAGKLADFRAAVAASAEIAALRAEVEAFAMRYPVPGIVHPEQSLALSQQ